MCAPLPYGDTDVFLSLCVFHRHHSHCLAAVTPPADDARCRTRIPRFSLAPECVSLYSARRGSATRNTHAKISTTSAPHHRRSTLTAHTLPRPPSPMTARASEDTPMRVADTRRCTPRQTITSRALGSNHQGNLIEMTERVYGPKQSPLELYHQRRL